jgi:carbon-monoxide dehydrogenase large subunit
MGKFGLGQPVTRREDPRLVTGRGRYAADVSLPGQAYAAILRSPHAHAELAAIDVEAARAVPGVLAVWIAQDAADDGLGDIRNAIPVHDREGRPLIRPARRLLARERVRFVGEPVAVVVAESLAAAKEALDQIAVDYLPLPAVATVEDAAAEGAPPIWEEAPGNLALYWQNGDAAACEAAFRQAAHVVRIDLINQRLVPCAMEPRAAVGTYDAGVGRYTLHTSCQGAHLIKSLLAGHTLNVPEDAIRVIVGDVGGGFGSKVFHYPEEALVLWAARRLARPVKWVGERWEAFVADTHGRAQQNQAEAAFAADGRILALRVHTRADLGAYLNYFGAVIPTQMTGCMLSGAYAIPVIWATCEGFYTNTVPVDAYRGAGRPEATYLLERLMDAASRRLAMPRDEIRRRNFIRADQMPYRTAAGPTYDSGDFVGIMEAAMAAADWHGFAARRGKAETRGRLRGIGMSTYVEICGFAEEAAKLRFAADGVVELLIGTQSTGQGHETAYAQIVADGLGIDIDRVRVIQGDTDRVATGQGTSGSRSLPVGGPATQRAVDAAVERGRSFAARLLQASPEEIRFADGRFQVADSGRGIAIDELAVAARDPENLPPGAAVPGLDAEATFAIEASTFPNGCHIAEVEIDPDTGTVAVVAYTVVDDFGTIVNPLLLKGQVQGGIVQGIGQALFEEARYDPESGQLLTGSFVDYALPHAADVPELAISFRSIPCRTNPLGIKGAGEAGTIGACPAVINAVLDALAAEGVEHLDMPATAEKIWRAIRHARLRREHS